MNILQVVAVRDSRIDSFGQPFFVSHVGAAIRSFQDEVNNPDSAMNKHPEDYDLYHIGEYDAEHGYMKPLDKNKQLALGREQIQPRT